MTLEQFKDILDTYRKFNDDCFNMNKVGVNLFEYEYPVAAHVDHLFSLFWSALYKPEAIDWINWFIYENDYGEKGMGAWDGETPICQTVEELYNYIDQYKLF